ncbi:THUMP domain-containing class I SAM-dependent RNA methyltransferase [Abyssicoccus albus]|uniref:THUMP domain-containing class I SAM-dependent RNA methyltransferase n=1 Tax=Abyssicoccus albus TaxID=1817405 RepID=UPI00097E294C|nr:class I SAM-dependent RNA methyltransferase [Abyssicoccus albus]AQL56178.1 RNA methyltransferase [Abyssicoccus albus]
MNYKLIATTPMGLESIVKDEVIELGYDPTVENGKVIFEGGDEAIAKANIHLRCADRVKLVVGEFKATTFDELFTKTKDLPWEHFISEKGKFPVNGKSHKSTLYSVPDCQSIVKKAIVERLKQAYNINGWLSETDEEYKIEVAILKDTVTITLDTSGSGLHKRGYRVEQGEAPLKETLAAALVKLTKWTGDTPLIDPFTGSGTIAIEAALIAQNIAPGFNRSFASEQWKFIDQSVFESVRTKAETNELLDRDIEIYAHDIDHNMIQMAERNAMEAGFSGVIKFKQMNAMDLSLTKPTGIIVCNPPYGERIGDVEKIEDVYRHIVNLYKENEYWSVYLMTSFEGFEDLVDKKATKRRKLFNGYLETTFYQYFGKKFRK